MNSPAGFSRAVEADMVCSLAGFPWVRGIYALELTAESRIHPDALAFAVVLVPYEIERLVETHHALLTATGMYAVTGRVLYVNGATVEPVPMKRARRLSVDVREREAATVRIARRKADASRERVLEAEAYKLNEAFRALRAQAARDTPPTRELTRSPYRRHGAHPTIEADPSAAGTAMAAPLGSFVLEVVQDPFPPPRRPRVFVVDEDAASERAFEGVRDLEVVFVKDGWTAIDRLTQEDFDLAIVAVRVGDLTASKIYRVVGAANPEAAGRIALLASGDAVANSPVSSRSARVITRPVTVEAVRAMLAK